MQLAGAHVAPVGLQRPSIEVADIARRFGDELKSSRALTPEQHRALDAIVSCRTARLGGHMDVCSECEYKRPAYNSCRDRHCPKCQWLASQRWLDRRLERLLPVHHFHVVFTLPSELRTLTMYNRELLFPLLFESASLTLQKLASDDQRLGASLGITAVLHTWTRDLSFHPHIHCVVTGGGLAADGRWVKTRPEFLFPVRVLGKLFRGIFLDGLRRLGANGKLKLRGKCSALATAEGFDSFIDKLHVKRWNVYSKRPFGGVDAVLRYLCKYTHRIAISNRRLISFDDSKVTLYTRQDRTVSLRPLGFLSRFVSHVLPKGFVRIRHFGLYASSNVNTKLVVARSLLGDQSIPVQATPPEADAPSSCSDEPDFVKRFRMATGIDLRTCPVCSANMNRRALTCSESEPRSANCRAPPKPT